MTSPGKKAAAMLLEEFAEACTATARSLSGHDDLGWENGKEGFVHFHCPTPGLRGSHQWNGGPRASAWLKQGEVHAHCAKCVGTKADYPGLAAYEAARDAYTDQVKRAIRWQQDSVIHAGFKHDILRSHLYYDRDFRHAVRRDKIRFQDGRKEKGNTNPWRWRVADLVDGRLGAFASAWPIDEWLLKHYPEHDKIYDALCWYGIEEFVDRTVPGTLTAATCPLKPSYRVLITEGEKDADSVNSLMVAGGYSELIATCLCSPKPLKLASHHVRLLEGRDVVVIGDADEPGRQHAESWTTLAWGHASSIKLIREQLCLAGTSEEKDVTDWILLRIGSPPPGKEIQEWVREAPYAKAVAEELVNLLASAAPLLEPIGTPTEWRTGMIMTQKGGVKADSPHNAERVWTMHPLLKGHVRSNLRSGEVEVTDPPWGGGTTVGARLAALSCAEWLERVEKLSLSIRMLEEVLERDSVAKPYNPLETLLATPWDGSPRIDVLLTRYIPLNVEHHAAVALARIMIGDLIMKLRGVQHAQRAVIGIGTDYPIDIAEALVGRHGMRHQGRLTDKHIEQYARHESGVVQITMEPVANRQAALVSIPSIFAKHMISKQRMLSLPLFVAVGDLPSDPRTDAKVDARCYLYDLKDEPNLHLLQGDADQIIAEGVVRLAELLAEPVPDKNATVTADARQEIEAAEHTLTGIYLYATKDVSTIDFGSSKLLASAAPRVNPLRHIVRRQFLQAMRLWMFDAYRDIHAQEAAFNSACRVMGWVKKSRSPTVDVTRNVAMTIRMDTDDRKRVTVAGVLLTNERLEQLKNSIFGAKNSIPTDDGGNFSGSFASSGGVPAGPKPSVAEGSVIPVEAYRVIESNSTKIATPCARAQGYTEEEEGRRWLAGPEAVNQVKDILSTPGIIAIDFETYPPSAKWVGDQEAERAEYGSKGAARKQAEAEAALAGRAHRRQACTLQVRHENGREVFCRLLDPMAELPAMFAPVLDQRPWEDGVTLIAHNAQFEAEVLLRHGVAVDIEDTMLAAKCLYLTAVGPEDPQLVSFSLAALVEKEFGRYRDKTIRERDWRLETSLDAEAVEYGLQDVRDCLELWQLYRARLVEEGLWEGYEVIARACLPTAALNLTGLTLNAEAHQALMVTMRDQAYQLVCDLDRICGGAIKNHGSTQQVSDWIMGVVLEDGPAIGPGAPPGDDRSSGPPDTAMRLSRFVMRLTARTNGMCKGWRTTKTGHLAITKGGKIRKAEQLHEAFPQISEYLLTHARWNKATKLLVAFGDGLRAFQDKDGRIRGQMKLGGTVTLRHSCVDPNLQQQPAEKEFRALWVAPPGRKLAIADYSQIELRLLAIVAHDERLREVYREGRDVHQETADIAGLPRKNAKNVNFAMAYGSGAAGMAENFGFTLDHAKAVLARVLGAYTGLAAFRAAAPAEARAQGFIAIRPSRRVGFEDGLSPATTTINYPIQGGAASVQMRALRLIFDALRERPDLDSFLAASVHDEFLIETPDDERAHEASAIMVDCMVQALLEIYPEAADMGMHRLSAAKICCTWAEKD